VGLATKIPKAPVKRPAATRYPPSQSLTESYKPILKLQNTIYLHNPLDNPLKRALNPSSFLMILIVLINPEY
jgi:hypothetical protein